MAFTEKYVTSAAAGGGDGSIGSPWTLDESFDGVGASGGTAATAGDRVNVQSDGAYSIGATTQLNAGTTADGVVWRGFNSAIGDLEGSGRNADGTLVTTNFPAITLTGTLNTKSYTILQNLNITGALSSVLIDGDANDWQSIISCKILNTQNNTAAKCFNTDNQGAIINSDLECSGAAHAVVCDMDGQTIAYGSRFKGVDTDILLRGTAFQAVESCVFEGPGVGINFQLLVGANTLIANNTFYGLATCIQLPNLNNTAPPVLINNHATDCTKWIENLYSGTADLGFIEINNRTRDNTTPRTGVGDYVLIGEITTDTGDHTTDYTDATTGDFTLISAAPGKAAGLIAYTDCGAYQREEPAGGGGSGGNQRLIIIN